MPVTVVHRRFIKGLGDPPTGGAFSLIAACALFVNDIDPSLDDVWADYTEMTGAGYARYNFPFGAWTRIDGAGFEEWFKTTPVVFNFGVPVGGPIVVYGVTLVDFTPQPLISRHFDVPYNVPPGGGGILTIPMNYIIQQQ